MLLDLHFSIIIIIKKNKDAYKFTVWSLASIAWDWKRKLFVFLHFLLIVASKMKSRQSNQQRIRKTNCKAYNHRRQWIKVCQYWYVFCSSHSYIPPWGKGFDDTPKNVLEAIHKKKNVRIYQKYRLLCKASSKTRNAIFKVNQGDMNVGK